MTLNEFDIIQTFFNKPITKSNANIILGIGDDAAIVAVPEHHELVITTDTLVANVHFPSHTSAYDIAYKALAVNLSDLAAMGATPAWVTLALTLPEANEQWLTDFSNGFFTLANHFHTALIGGDITRGPLSITIQAHGIIPKGLALRRDNAQVGDLIFVTHTLGDAGLALQHQTLPQNILDKFYRPEPQIVIGEKLRGIANAAIDISDGLAADLGHILEKSHVGAEIIVDKIPLSHSLLEFVSIEQGIQLALTAGDDYELCFTVPENKLSQLNNNHVTCIGKITKNSGLDLHYQNGKKYDLKIHGYQHF
jgi:thiamine-monophosphate kinase